MTFRSQIFAATLAVACLAVASAVSAQGLASSPFSDIDEALLQAASGDRLIVPERYRTVAVDAAALRSALDAAPPEFSGVARPPLALPMPDGSSIEIEIEDAPMMAPALAQHYPGIRTLRAYRRGGVEAPVFSGRLDWTSAGFHAILFTDRGTVFIDPYARGDADHYISYYKHDFRKAGANPFSCEVVVDGSAGQPASSAVSAADSGPGKALGSGTELRTYRLAMAANYEYTQFHSGPLPAAPSKSAALNNGIIPTMNRVNAIYERDVAATMVLIPNEEDIIWDTPADPYTNEDGLTMLEQNRVTLNAIVGNANYDIGHVFSTGGGGIAGLGVVCLSGVNPLANHKAYGVTGNPAPVGDPFDVDYVAHEVGHQFGANHTFNGNAGSCSGGNRNGGTAYEVGSGTTIMAYAGICGAQNVQFHSDAYFHVASIDEIVAYSTSGSGNNCAVITATGNTPPTVDAGANFTIPMNTPFALTAVGADADGDPLTYTWEEHDLGPANAGTTDNGSSPIFRSFSPVPSPTRTFPQLSDLLNNTTTYGETLPTTNRVMNFRVTARDNRLDGGGVEWDEMDVSVTTTSGPFRVTQPNGGELWTGGALEDVFWNVANTTAAPVSTPNVNIWLSTDGGYTFPILLAANVPNDGAEPVVAPNLATQDARVKVQGAGNIFFDISNAVFTIQPSTGPPVAFDDTATTGHNTAVDIFVLANDTDPDNDPLAIVAVDSPTTQGGSAVIDNVTDPTEDFIRYTPANGFDGVDTFDYTIDDGTGSDSATVRVVVAAACAPTATGSFFDDFESLAPGWTVDTAANGFPASITWTPVPDSTSHSPTFSFMSDSSTLFEKDDRLIAPAQKISSSSELSFWHRFSFEETYDGGVLEVSLDDGANWVDVVDAGGVFLSEGYNSTIAGGFGSRIAGRDAWSGDRPNLPTNRNQFQVQIDLGALNPFNLEVPVLFRWRLVGDPFAAGATPGLNWLIDDVEFTNLLEPGACTGPVAVDDFTTTLRGTAVIFDLLANDYHPSSESFAVDQVNQPSNGSVVDHGDGTVTYTPDADFVGIDSFSYTICDLDEECDTAVARVQVQPANRDPVAVGDSATTTENQPVTIAVLANDSDPDGDPLAISRVQDTSDQGGSVSIDDNGTPADTTDDQVVYTPANGFFGTDNFTYTIVDGQGGSAQGTVTVTVEPINDPPVAADDAYSTDEDVVLTVPAPGVLGNDTDPDGDPLEAMLVSGPANGMLTLAADGSFSYTPNLNYHGGDAFTYQACDRPAGDDDRLCSTAGVDLTVNSINDAPVAADDAASTLADTAVTIDVLANDTDVDGDPLVVGAGTDALSAEGGAVANNGSDVTYTPPAGFEGTDTFNYQACDPSNACAIATVTVVVRPATEPCDFCTVGDPVEFDLTYLGGDCSASANTQGGKAACTDFAGPPPSDQPVFIVVSSDEDADDDSDDEFFRGPVDPEQAFLTSAAHADKNDLPSKVFVHIFSDDPEAGGVLLQTNEVHTSCSAPMIEGERFGAVQLGDANEPGQCPAITGGRVHGSGHLNALLGPGDDEDSDSDADSDSDDDSDNDKVHFSFDAKIKSGELKGKLKVKDKEVEVKIDAKTITTLSAGTAACNGQPLGANSWEFTAEGTFELAGVKTPNATFRVCGEDNGKPGKGHDRFYLECVSGCVYDTGSRVIDDVIDGGNIHIHDPIAAGGSAKMWSTQSALSGTDTDVLDLDPLLLDEAPAGLPQIFVASLFTDGGLGLSARQVTLTWTDAANVKHSATALTDHLGVAAFVVTMPAGGTEFFATANGLQSNGAYVTGIGGL